MNNQHKISKELKGTTQVYTFNFNYNNILVRSLLEVHLITDICNIILEYSLINPLMAIIDTIPYSYNNLKYKKIIIVNEDNCRFVFYVGFRLESVITSIYEYMEPILDINIYAHNNKPNINYHHIFEDYVKYLGNINGSYKSSSDVRKAHINVSQKITPYFSKFKEKTNVTNICEYNTDANRFDIYKTLNVGILHVGHLVVKDHVLLKCIIEVIKYLHDDGVFDDVIDL